MLVVLIIISFVIVLIFFWCYCKLTCGSCNCSKHLVGKVVVVTGANTGIGFETAKDLAERGARVIIGCRNEVKGIAAREKIIAISGNNNVHLYHLDLSSFTSIRTFANCILENEQYLHILINNAGYYPKGTETTEDGLLTGMQTNYFGPFLLTNLLLPLIRQSAPSRIINVSSLVHAFGSVDLENLNMERSKKCFVQHFTYFNSKLCLNLMTLELDRHLIGSGVTVNCLNPGAVNTNMVNVNTFFIRICLKLFRPFLKSPKAGAQTSIYLAVSPDVEDVSGCYFQDCHLTSTSREAKDIDLAKKLWFISQKIVDNKGEHTYRSQDSLRGPDNVMTL